MEGVQGRKKRGSQRGEDGGGVGGVFPFAALLGSGGSKRGAETHFLSRHEQLRRHILLFHSHGLDVDPPRPEIRSWFSSGWTRLAAHNTVRDEKQLCSSLCSDSRRVRFNLVYEAIQENWFSTLLFMSVLESFDFYSFHWLTSVYECATCLLICQEVMMPVALSRVQAVWLMLLSSQAGHCKVPVCYDFPSLDSPAIHHWFEVFFSMCVWLRVCHSIVCTSVCV